MLNVDVGGVGSEDGVKGWKTLDIRHSADYIYNFNTGKPFPFKDGDVDNFYCSHTLEHVKPYLTQFVVNEFHRCLRRKGLIRIVVPDMELAIRWYLAKPKKLKTKGYPSKPDFYPETRMSRLLSWFYTENPKKKKITDGHYMGFDWELLEQYLRTAGFCGIGRFAYGKYSGIFKGKDKKRYKDYSIYAEARK